MNTTDSFDQNFSTITRAIPADQSDLLLQYIQLVYDFNQQHNITACRTTAAQLNELIAPSLALIKPLQQHHRLIDLGSGSGIPGIVLAICQPQQDWILVEQSTKKAWFLQQTIQRLQLKNCRVFAQPLAQLPLDSSIQAIVCRGAGPLQKQLHWTKSWRKQGTALLSIQTPLSYQRAGTLPPHEKLDLCTALCGKIWHLVIID